MPTCITASSARPEPVSATLARWLMQRWYGGLPPAWPLRLLAGAYGFAMRLRRWGYRRGWFARHGVGVPVLVVGNRTVGGTGKTPLVIALARALTARGWRVGVVSRGHGRLARLPCSVHATSHPRDCGDEPLLIHLECAVPVEVDRDRVAAARRLVAAGCDLVLADDGLQHLRLLRTIELEVEDARGLGNGRVLPAGPLREPLPSTPAFARIVHGRPLRGDEVALSMRLGEPWCLNAPDQRRPLAAFAGRALHALAGIGDPSRFFAALRAHGLDPIEHPFPDHHVYRAADVAAFAQAMVLMTAKDAVKCRQLGLVDAWVLPLIAELPGSFLDRLETRLREPSAHVPA